MIIRYVNIICTTVIIKNRKGHDFSEIQNELTITT